MSRPFAPVASMVVLLGSQLILVPYQYMISMSANLMDGRRHLVTYPTCLYVAVPPLLTTAALFWAGRAALFPGRSNRWTFAASVVIAWGIAVTVLLVATGVIWYWRSRGH